MLDYRLSDLSEEEIDNYFHTKEEAKLKGVLWTAMNQDYIEKQALKAALASKVRIIFQAWHTQVEIAPRITPAAVGNLKCTGSFHSLPHCMTWHLTDAAGLAACRNQRRRHRSHS